SVDNSSLRPQQGLCPAQARIFARIITDLSRNALFSNEDAVPGGGQLRRSLRLGSACPSTARLAAPVSRPTRRGALPDSIGQAQYGGFRLSQTLRRPPDRRDGSGDRRSLPR